MNEWLSFTGKTAISTGAASGMGLLFAQNFASFGGNVVLCDVNESVIKEKAHAKACATVSLRNCPYQTVPSYTP